MPATKQHVTIKGVKDGLVFILDDACDFAQLIDELQHKLRETHHQILTGPIVDVHIKLGNRIVSEAQKMQIREVFSERGNLLIQSIESLNGGERWMNAANHMKVIRGVIRSGQISAHEGSVLLLGDVNPGGTIASSGDIVIMGALRGTAHAGMYGNEKAIIAASYMKPTQLRIATVISRPPDEWGFHETYMEFAYLRNGVMEIDKIHQLHRIRPEARGI